jgi:hypothetical protein
MIMRDSVPRRLTRLVMGLGLTLGGVFLALAPGRASEDPPLPPAPPVAPRPAEPAAAERFDPRLDLDKAEEADRIRQEMRKLHEALQRLENRLAEIEGRPVAPRAAMAGGSYRRAAPALPSVPGTPAPPAPPGGGIGGMPPPGADVPRGHGFGGSSGGGFGGGPDMGGGKFPGLPGPAVERRMDDMQRAIEQLSRELTEMRRLLQDQRGPGRGRGGDRPGASTTPAPPTPAGP